MSLLVRVVALPSAVCNIAAMTLAGATGQWIWFAIAAAGSTVSVYGWWLVRQEDPLTLEPLPGTHLAQVDCIDCGRFVYSVPKWADVARCTDCGRKFRGADPELPAGR